MPLKFEFQGHLIGFEKINKQWANLLFKKQENCPEKVLVSRETFEKNADLLFDANKRKDRDEYDLSVKGNGKFKDGKWVFIAYGVFESIPTLTGLSSSEIDNLINETFEERRKSTNESLENKL